MGSPERIRELYVAPRFDEGTGSVVPRRWGETNRLLALAKDLNPRPMRAEARCHRLHRRAGLDRALAIALHALGLKAKSYTGWQVPITTDNAFAKARILKIEEKRIRADLDAGNVVIVAGFQGIDDGHNITTLGRGGSDTTGVALAAALKADECQIYTDVDGVYTTDPRTPGGAPPRPVTFEGDAPKAAFLGSKVLQIRSGSSPASTR